MRSIPRRAVILPLLLLLFAAGAQASPGTRREILPSQREMIIHHAYKNLTKLVVAGGDQIHFQITNLRTTEAARFDEVLWVDLMTMPGGDMVNMTRESSRYNGRNEFVVYRAQWKQGAEDYLLSPEGLRLIDLKAGQVLAEIATQTPSARGVTAITSYDVTVTYKERSRAYKAAVLWLAPFPNSDATLFFMDHITQGLEEAVRERPVARRKPAAPRGAKVVGAACEPTTSSKRLYKTLSDRAYHSSGSHSAEADVEFTCSCASDCSATCSPEFVTQYCDDYGIHWDACHKMATSIDLSTSATGDGRSSAPACAAGLGCIKKSCLYCACGLQVAVTVSGTEVTFASGGSPDWQGNLEFSMQCGTCAQVPPADNEFPDDFEQDLPGGGSGGGTGGCSYWHTTCNCGYRSNGTYYCECRPDYCIG